MSVDRICRLQNTRSLFHDLQKMLFSQLINNNNDNDNNNNNNNNNNNDFNTESKKWLFACTLKNYLTNILYID